MLEAVLPEACNFIKKETIALLFSCEFCKIFKNTFLQNTHGKLEHIRESVWFMQLEHLNENFIVTVQISSWPCALLTFSALIILPVSFAVISKEERISFEVSNNGDNVPSLREKCPNTEFFLVRIFPHSDWIWRDTPYSYLDTFHAVHIKGWCTLTAKKSSNKSVSFFKKIQYKVVVNE